MLPDYEEHQNSSRRRGNRPADYFVRGGTIASVYSGELHSGNIAFTCGRIAYVGGGERAVGPDTRIIDTTGKTVAPGYVEAHFHPLLLDASGARQFVISSASNGRRYPRGEVALVLDWR